MSFLSLYFNRDCIVCASDDLVSIEQNGKRIPLEERSPKFQTIQTPGGPVLLGCVGRSDCCRQLVTGTRRMVADLGTTLDGLREGFSAEILKAVYEKRPTSSLPPECDAFQVMLAGYDAAEQRMRVFAYVLDNGDFKEIELTANPSNCVGCFGWAIETDFADLDRFSDYVGRNAPKHDLTWVAQRLADQTNKIKNKYPNAVGKASYFAALVPAGVFVLPQQFPPAPEVSLQPVAANAENAAGAVGRFFVGTYHKIESAIESALNGSARMFVGSITTPPAGGQPTIGNNDGGAGNQVGEVKTHFFGSWKTPIVFNAAGATTQTGATGTGSVSNGQNAIDGSDTTFATISTGTSGTAELDLTTVAGVSSRYSKATLYVLYDIPQNDGSAFVDIQYNQGSSFLGDLVSRNDTCGLTTASIDLPFGLNLATVSVRAVASSPNITLRIYNAYVKVVD